MLVLAGGLPTGEISVTRAPLPVIVRPWQRRNDVSVGVVMNVSAPLREHAGAAAVNDGRPCSRVGGGQDDAVVVEEHPDWDRAGARAIALAAVVVLDRKSLRS